ncbi:hypothetical protein AZA_19637 [Nitrospirillum viridazoti Y2]|nr:hypothetical protein AZA_19637 [Nitrospirillum amazonense Y2]
MAARGPHAFPGWAFLGWLGGVEFPWDRFIQRTGGGVRGDRAPNPVETTGVAPISG